MRSAWGTTVQSSARSTVTTTGAHQATMQRGSAVDFGTGVVVGVH